LLRWGLEFANKDNLLCYLEGLSAAAPMYERFGWVTKEVIGVLDTFECSCMLREPQSLPASRSKAPVISKS
jgi:hypothetical protein